MSMHSVTTGVDYDTMAREWRLKWSEADEKRSLAAVQQEFASLKPELEKIPGIKCVERIVCGTCKDYKVILALPIDKFEEWQKSNYAPEEKFLHAVSQIPGVEKVETQAYSIMPVLENK
jgi:hypothetical protein